MCAWIIKINFKFYRDNFFCKIIFRNIWLHLFCFEWAHFNAQIINLLNLIKSLVVCPFWAAKTKYYESKIVDYNKLATFCTDVINFFLVKMKIFRSKWDKILFWMRAEKGEQMLEQRRTKHNSTEKWSRRRGNVSEKEWIVNEEQTFDFEFGVPGVAVPPGIVDDSLIPPWLPLPFEMGVLNVVTDDCVMFRKQCAHSRRDPRSKREKRMLLFMCVCEWQYPDQQASQQQQQQQKSKLDEDKKQY